MNRKKRRGRGGGDWALKGRDFTCGVFAGEETAGGAPLSLSPRSQQLNRTITYLFLVVCWLICSLSDKLFRFLL